MSKQLSSHTLRGGKLSGAVSLLLVQCMMVIGPTSPLVVVVLLWLGYTWSALLLALLISAEQLTKARHSPLLCRFYLQIAGCFRKGVTLHVDEAAVEAMQQNDGAMWCMHPHGTFFGFGFSLNGAMRWKAMRPEHYENPDWSKLMDPSRLERMSGVMAPLLFKIPLVRSFLFGAGCSTPATKAGMHGLMRQRADFGIITGGMEEVALYKYRHERVFIRKRAGFIKYALQHGYKLVLSYTFGEADTYKSLQLGGLAMWIQKTFGFIAPVFWGPNWMLPFLPDDRAEIHTVVAHPIQLPRIESPSEDDVAKWHLKYIDELQALYDEYKGRFGHADRPLEVL